MTIVGIDEVGRGCWAGPLVAGAVVLGAPIAGLKDSKKLSKKRRDELSAQIHEQALAVGIGWVDAATIDKVGITTAVKMAMERALQAVSVDYDQVIIDGDYNFLEHMPKTEPLIKADDLIPAVSAASIVAKVARDTYMAELPEQYAAYAFGSHVGYGTALHRERLALHGVSDMHRRSFKPIKILLE